MARLSPQQRKFLALLSSMRGGEVLERDRLLRETGWSPNALATHLGKNKLVEFVREQPDGSFVVLRRGDTITEADVHRAMTQVSPPDNALSKDDVFYGESGTYVLEAKIGEGAIGHVWRARDSDQECPVAVKIARPRPDLLEESRFGDVRDRFRRESRHGRTLTHDCIVRVLDHGEFKGQPFLVMELAARSIGARLKDQGPFTTREALEAIIRCTRGLAHLHRHGSVHRDIKPDNLLETERGIVVGDLGIVRWGDLNPSFTNAATLTHASVQLGSWFYMAPEQQQSPHEAGPPSDVYSLGVAWYEMLTRSLPIPAQFAAKKYEPASSNAAVNRLISAMTSFAAEDRPELESVGREAALLLSEATV